MPCSLLFRRGSSQFLNVTRRCWALDSYNSGWQGLESNDLPTAERKLNLAYAYVPENAETNFALGNLHLLRSEKMRPSLSILPL